MTRLAFITGIALCFIIPGLAQNKQAAQQQNVTTTPQMQQQQQNATTTPSGQQHQQQERQNATTPTVHQQQERQNTTTGTQQHGEQEELRPSAMSQLEVLLLGNHSWTDPNKTYSYFQNDYQIVNHSPHEICNVSLSTPLENPERTWVSSSYNAHLTNSTGKRGIDIIAPADNSTFIPANGMLNIGYILQQAVQSGQGNMSNMTTMASGLSRDPPTVESAQYCDELNQTDATTGGMTGGADNTTTRANVTTHGQEERNNTTVVGGSRAKAINGKKRNFRHV
ncbi:Hypothetical protein NocV09_07900110 [Nannochloropsis oceanica]